MGWVTERSKCTLEFAFDAIRDFVERDTEEAKKLIPEGQRETSFSVTLGNHGGIIKRFYVTAFLIDGDPDRDERTIKFELHKNKIVIDRSGGPDTHPVMPNMIVKQKWDIATSSCLLCINSEPKSALEISQLALEPLFFG